MAPKRKAPLPHKDEPAAVRRQSSKKPAASKDTSTTTATKSSKPPAKSRSRAPSRTSATPEPPAITMPKKRAGRPRKNSTASTVATVASFEAATSKEPTPDPTLAEPPQTRAGRKRKVSNASAAGSVTSNADDALIGTRKKRAPRSRKASATPIADSQSRSHSRAGSLSLSHTKDTLPGSVPESSHAPAAEAEGTDEDSVAPTTAAAKKSASKEPPTAQPPKKRGGRSKNAPPAAELTQAPERRSKRIASQSRENSRDPDRIAEEAALKAPEEELAEEPALPAIEEEPESEPGLEKPTSPLSVASETEPQGRSPQQDLIEAPQASSLEDAPQAQDGHSGRPRAPARPPRRLRGTTTESGVIDLDSHMEDVGSSDISDAAMEYSDREDEDVVMESVEYDSEPLQIVENDNENLQIVEDDNQSVQIVEDGNEHLQIVQDDNEPLQIVQDGNEPLQIVQDDNESLQIVQDDNQHPQIVQDDNRPLEEANQSSPAPDEGLRSGSASPNQPVVLQRDYSPVPTLGSSYDQAKAARALNTKESIEYQEIVARRLLNIVENGAIATRASQDPVNSPPPRSELSRRLRNPQDAEPHKTAGAILEEMSEEYDATLVHMQEVRRNQKKEDDPRATGARQASREQAAQATAAAAPDTPNTGKARNFLANVVTSARNSVGRLFRAGGGGSLPRLFQTASPAAGQAQTDVQSPSAARVARRGDYAEALDPHHLPAGRPVRVLAPRKYNPDLQNIMNDYQTAKELNRVFAQALAQEDACKWVEEHQPQGATTFRLDAVLFDWGRIKRTKPVKSGSFDINFDDDEFEDMYHDEAEVEYNYNTKEWSVVVPDETRQADTNDPFAQQPKRTKVLHETRDKAPEFAPIPPEHTATNDILAAAGAGETDQDMDEDSDTPLKRKVAYFEDAEEDTSFEEEHWNKPRTARPQKTPKSIAKSVQNPLFTAATTPEPVADYQEKTARPQKTPKSIAKSLQNPMLTVATTPKTAADYQAEYDQIWNRRTPDSNSSASKRPRSEESETPGLDEDVHQASSTIQGVNGCFALGYHSYDSDSDSDSTESDGSEKPYSPPKPTTTPSKEAAAVGKSGPSQQIFEALGSESGEQLAAARAVAQKHKPKTPSTLRTVTRYPTESPLTPGARAGSGAVASASTALKQTTTPEKTQKASVQPSSPVHSAGASTAQKQITTPEKIQKASTHPSSVRSPGSGLVRLLREDNERVRILPIVDENDSVYRAEYDSAVAEINAYVGESETSETAQPTTLHQISS